MSLIEKVIDEVDIERIYNHVLNLEGIRHPLDSYKSLLKAANFIESEFNNYQMVPKRDFFSIEGITEQFFNIEAYFVEKDQIDLSQPTYLVTSHFDTVYNSPGADDNASAVAIMLEVARILKDIDLDLNVGFVSFNLEEGSPYIEQQIRKLGIETGIFDESYRIRSWYKKKRLERISTMIREISGRRYCDENAWNEIESKLENYVSLQEREFFKKRNELLCNLAHDDWVGRTGLLGSGVWAEKAVKEKMNIRGVINLESIGYSSNKPNSQWFPTGLSIDFFKRHRIEEDSMVGNFLTIIVDEISSTLGAAIFKSCSLDLIDLPCALLSLPLNYNSISQSFPDLLRSDHAPFWQKGFPAAMLTDTANFRNPYYHTGGDTITTLDFSFMKKISQAIISTLIQIK